MLNASQRISAPRIRQARKGREQERNLRRIEREVADACGGGNALGCEFSLRAQVVEIRAAMSERERTQSCRNEESQCL